MNQRERIGTSVASTNTDPHLRNKERWNRLREHSKGDDKEIEMLCEHFKHEVDMLRFADFKMDELTAEINITLESFLVHWGG